MKGIYQALNSIAKLCFLFLMLLISAQVLGQQSADTVRTYRLAQGKKLIKSGAITMGVGVAAIIISRILPNEERHGWDFSPQGKDILMLGGLITSTVGFIILAKGFDKVKKANLAAGVTFYYKSPGIVSGMPAISLSFTL